MRKTIKVLTLLTFLFSAVALSSTTALAADYVTLDRPTGLNAQVVNGDDVRLTWDLYGFPTDCNQAREIIVHRNGSLRTSVGGHNTSYTDEGLSNDIYEYQIQAKCKYSSTPRDQYLSPLTLVTDQATAVVSSAPACSGNSNITATASPVVLWPPNGKLVQINVTGTVSAPANCSLPNEIVYFVNDEYRELSSANEIPVTLVSGGFSFTVSLEASRRGDDPDGRLYTIELDGVGVEPFDIDVIVPHDQRKK